MCNKIILAEGPDGAGKTTLLTCLSKITGRSIVHGGGPPETRAELIERIERSLKETESLLDRSQVISEQVYGPVLNGRTLLTQSELDLYTFQMIEAGATVIYCRPSDETILNSLNNLVSKPHKSPSHLRKVQQCFFSILVNYDRVINRVRMLGLDVIRYSYDTTPIDDLVKRLNL